jgi:hypothetical protein
MDYQISEYIDRKLVFETVVSNPALAGITVRGFILSDNRRECILFTPVGEPKP